MRRERERAEAGELMKEKMGEKETERERERAKSHRGETGRGRKKKKTRKRIKRKREKKSGGKWRDEARDTRESRKKHVHWCFRCRCTWVRAPLCGGARERGRRR